MIEDSGCWFIDSPKSQRTPISRTNNYCHLYTWQTWKLQTVDNLKDFGDQMNVNIIPFV